MTDHTLLDEQQKKLKGVPKRKQRLNKDVNKDVNKSGETDVPLRLAYILLRSYQ